MKFYLLIAFPLFAVSAGYCQFHPETVYVGLGLEQVLDLVDDDVSMEWREEEKKLLIYRNKSDSTEESIVDKLSYTDDNLIKEHLIVIPRSQNKFEAVKKWVIDNPDIYRIKKSENNMYFIMTHYLYSLNEDLGLLNKSDEKFYLAYTYDQDDRYDYFFFLLIPMKDDQKL